MYLTLNVFWIVLLSTALECIVQQGHSIVRFLLGP
jgi:hypothetical protein